MFGNYFKIAWRNIVRNRFYSVIHVFGLSVGIAFALMISAYVWKELRVNDELKNSDHQYIIQSKWKDPNQGYFLTTLGPLPKALRENYPGLVKNYYRYDGITSNVSKGNRIFREGLQVGDSTLLGMYGFSLAHGNAATALNEPFMAVISTDKAIKYFGKTDVVGEAITIENFSGSKHDFLITGVLNKHAKNSVTTLVDNYPNEIFISSVNLPYFGRNMDWPNSSIAGYIELQDNVKPGDLARPIAHLLKQNTDPQIVADLTPQLVLLKDYYLTANNRLVEKMLFALSAIAVFIMIMAILNFINLSVSMSTARMREIGIRKVLGGLKIQLIIQFLAESIIIVSLSTFFAYMIYFFARNLFGEILGSHLPKVSEFPISFIWLTLLFILMVGVLSGIYPALVLSSMKAVNSLKGKLSSAREKLGLRKALTVFQFSIAAIAFVGAIVVSQQIDLFLSKDLGYNKDFVLSAQVPRNWSKDGVDKMITARNQFISSSAVAGVSLAYEIPDGNNAAQVQLYNMGENPNTAITGQLLQTDETYLDVYKISLKAGKFFEGHRQDSAHVILNEAGVHALGIKDVTNAVGKQIRINGDPTVFTIKGVTDDFHFGSMQKEVQPICFFNVEFSTAYRYLSFKIKPGDVSSSIKTLQHDWSTILPGAPFEYKFMDETLANLYRSEIQLRKASQTATVLAIVIMLLGVFGLISLSIQKRVREIGIRKILGSSVGEIIGLFAKEYLRVIIIATVIAAPLSYLIMNQWLNTYAYRIQVTALPIVISIISLAMLTFPLVVFQTLGAARANPVKSLRSE